MDLSELPRGSFLRHPWEVARARFFLGELKKAGVLAGAQRILDVGSGDAWFASLVADANPEAEVVCWDLGYENGKPAPRDRMAYTSTKPEGTFDALILLDVAEHVPDDRSFLRDVLSVMGPKTPVLFSVPAWPSIYSNHDEALRHYRRYTPDSARTLLQECGLKLKRENGLFHSLLVPRFVTARIQNRPAGLTLTDNPPPPPADLAWKAGRATHGLVSAVLAVDGAVSRLAATLGLELPGLSYWALCHKS